MRGGGCAWVVEEGEREEKDNKQFLNESSILIIIIISLCLIKVRLFTDRLVPNRILCYSLSSQFLQEHNYINNGHYSYEEIIVNLTRK